MFDQQLGNFLANILIFDAESEPPVVFSLQRGWVQLVRLLMTFFLHF